ncbi:MAG: hypothetical protein ACI4XF_06045 [Oscillospiraceae bacterium]
MKKFTIILCAAMICMTFSSCGRDGSEEVTDITETTVIEWDGEPPQNILNTDFRSIVWGMTDYEISRQEQRYSDGYEESFMYYNDVRFAGFDSRLYYYFDELRTCSSAAYMISLSPDDPSYDSAFGRIDNFLTELFAPPDEEGGNIRTTPSAVIELTSEDTELERIVCVKFSMPEGYKEKKKYSKVICFEDGEPVSSSVSP